MDEFNGFCRKRATSSSSLFLSPLTRGMLGRGSSAVMLLDAGEDSPGDRGNVTGSAGELVLVLSSALSIQTAE